MIMRMHEMLAKGSKPAASGSSAGAVWRGEIVEVLTGGMVWVLVPALMGSEPVGPLPVFGGPVPVRGTMVMVFAVGGRRDDLVVLPPAG